MLSFCVGVGGGWGPGAAGEFDARGTQAIETVADLRRALTCSLASLKELGRPFPDITASIAGPMSP